VKAVAVHKSSLHLFSDEQISMAPECEAVMGRQIYYAQKASHLPEMVQSNDELLQLATGTWGWG